MKLALLSGASPRTCQQGPVVRLLSGNYAIHIHGKNDSELALSVDGIVDPMHLFHGAGLLLDKAVSVQVMFVKRGTEPYISILAENTNG